MKGGDIGLFPHNAHMLYSQPYKYLKLPNI